MAQHEPVDPLDEFEALLQQELAVAPSPEFLPRVREAVRLERTPAVWRRFWFLAPMAAAATILLAAALWLSHAQDPIVPSAPAADMNLAVVAPPPVSRPAESEPRVAKTEDRRPKSEERRAHSEQRTAEVIVDQRQRAALMALMRMANDGRLTEESFKTTTQPPAELGVDPVAVSPIVVGGVLQGESDRK